MSVKAVSLRGRQMWQIQIWRDGGAYNRRRYLDRKRFLKTDALALEAEMLDEYERTKEGLDHDDEAHPIPRPRAEAISGAPEISSTAKADVTSAKSAATSMRAQSSAASIEHAYVHAHAPVPIAAPTSTSASTTTRRTRRSAASPESAPAPLPPEPPPTSAIPTLAEFAERYLAIQDVTRSDTRNKVRDLRLHLVPILGALRLDQIGRQHVDDLKIRLRTPTGDKATSRRSQTREEAPVSTRRKGGSRSPKTINNILGTLRSVLGLALEYELVDRLPRIRLERTDKKDPRFLDFAEADALVEATPPDHRAMVLTLVRTGVRQGELQELRWRDLTLDGARPTLRVSRAVRRHVGGAFEVKATKSRRPRSVPLCSDVTAALRGHRRQRGRAADDDLVFPGEDGGYTLGDRLRRLLAAAAQDAQLGKHVHPHMLRHTFASHCTMRGVPPQVIQKWLGHASVTTTQRYAHLRPDTGDELIELLSGDGGGRAQADVLKITNNTTNNSGDANVKTPSTGS